MPRRLAAAVARGKLASHAGARHSVGMRRLLLLTSLASLATLTLAGCGKVPAPVEAPPPAPQPAEHGDLIGLSAQELVQRLGTPALQVREGDGLKLQYRAPACVLDAYLYVGPSGTGVAHVTHVDVRDRDGHRADQAACVVALTAP